MSLRASNTQREMGSRHSEHLHRQENPESDTESTSGTEPSAWPTFKAGLGGAKRPEKELS